MTNTIKENEMTNNKKVLIQEKCNQTRVTQQARVIQKSNQKYNQTERDSFFF